MCHPLFLLVPRLGSLPDFSRSDTVSLQRRDHRSARVLDHQSVENPMSQQSPYPNQTLLAFVRSGSFGAIDSMAIVTIRHATVMRPSELRTVVCEGLTHWVSTTNEGRFAWDASCEDFNVGDLADQGVPDPLSEWLAERGIAIQSVDTLHDDAMADFDMVLPFAA